MVRDAEPQPMPAATAWLEPLNLSERSQYSFQRVSVSIIGSSRRGALILSPFQYGIEPSVGRKKSSWLCGDKAVPGATV